MAVCAVHTIRDGNVSHAVAGEEDVDVATCFDVITTKTGKVFGDDAFHGAVFDVGNHALKVRAVEVASCVAIIHIIGIVRKAVVLGIVAEHGFLIADAHTFIFAPVLQGKTAVQSGDGMGRFPVHTMISFDEQGHDTEIVSCRCSDRKHFILRSVIGRWSVAALHLHALCHKLFKSSAHTGLACIRG